MKALKILIHDMANTASEVTGDYAVDYVGDYGNLKDFKPLYCEKSSEEYIESSYGSMYASDFDEILKETIVESDFFQDARQDFVECLIDDKQSKLEDIVYDNRVLLSEAMSYVKYGAIPSCESDIKSHIEKLVDIIEDMEKNVFGDGSIEWKI